jgi:hypothetical protein
VSAKCVYLDVLHDYMLTCIVYSFWRGVSRWFLYQVSSISFILESKAEAGVILRWLFGQAYFCRLFGLWSC